MSQATLGATPYRNSGLFADYYLRERIQDLETWDCDDPAQAAFDRLRELYIDEQELVASYEEDELIDAWIDPVIDALGFDKISETTLPGGGGYVDGLLYESAEDRREAMKRKKDGDRRAAFARASAILEVKQWDADFEAEFGEQRNYRDASNQIKYYLERTPDDLAWGVLTNGRQWRLYSTKDYETQIYYEVDLPEILASGDLEQFKYFYTFFGQSAFHETAGTTFLETVWSESETAAEELGEDLQDNVFTALRVLGRGFVEYNDLDIDPDDGEALSELKEQSLVLLYRLMFVLYAESRDLIHPDDPQAEDEYEANFSLNAIRKEIFEEIQAGKTFDEAFSEYATGYWGRLEDLFELIDNGEESLGIPPYNGGLFDQEEHVFLTENEVSDRRLAEVIYGLSTVENDEGKDVLADYADLDTRHLGSVYEGLLEHDFRIAPEQYAAVAEDGAQVWQPATEVSVADAVETVPEGGLYVVNDEGERKATGAYYTPDYVVTYIVEETVGPLVDDIEADLQERGLERSDVEYFRDLYDGVQDLRILDPAMGSGHFLTKATAYLTERVMEVVREQEQFDFPEAEIRRTIAKECIYGVDLNGMAVELAKLSMWLETLAADKPLAFFDHHLKTGNSLVGSDITEVLADDNSGEGGQLTLTQVLDRARRRTLEHVMDLMQELLAIDNDELADIKSMEELYDEIREDPLYGRLFELANVHTAERFGLDVPEGSYEKMADAIEDSGDWAEIREQDWFASAQAMAGDETFFHWELEFPEVFFDAEGEKMDAAGFDAVVGNPPYFNLETTKGTGFNAYLSVEYDEIYSGKADVLYFFCDRLLELCDSGLSFIVSRYFTEAYNAKDFRERLTDRSDVRSLVDFGNNQVFSGVDTLTVVLTLSPSSSGEPADIIALDDNLDSDHSRIETALSNLTKSAASVTDFGGKYTLPQDEFGRERWLILPKEYRDLKSKVEEKGEPLGSFCRTGQGMMTGLNEAFTVTPNEIKEWGIESEALRPLVKNGDLRPFLYLGNDKKLIYLENSDIEDYPRTEAYLEQYRSQLEERAKADSIEWHRYQNPINKDLFETVDQKILCPFIATDNRFYLDKMGLYNDGGDVEIIVQDGSISVSDSYLVAVLNSDLLEFFHLNHAKLKRDGFYEYFGNSLRELPIITDPKDHDRENSNAHELLSEYEREITNLKQQKLKLNLSLLDHLGNYSEGQTLAEIGLTQPPEGAADSILQQTATERPNLRVGEATVERESDNTVEIRLTARYKPEDSETRPQGGSRDGGTGEARGTDSHETDQWGYTETEPLPALRITDLTATEADLIAAFVPVAVDEAGGFADFRETATKTNSLVDRLRKLTLPRRADVEAGLESYVETKARAEELDEKIERTDDLIDEIVYELYGLTDEEIAIVEEAVGD